MRRAVSDTLPYRRVVAVGPFSSYASARRHSRVADCRATPDAAPGQRFLRIAHERGCRECSARAYPFVERVCAFWSVSSTMVEYALEEPASAAMMASAPEAEALEEAEQEVSSKARALAAGSEPAEEIDAVEAEMVAEAAEPSQREAAPQQEDATVAAAEAPPTDDQQGVSAMALQEESDVEPAKSEEFSADDEAGPGDVSESADSVAPSLLDREEPRDAQSGSALETDVPAAAEELLLGGGSGESPGQSGERGTWTIPRILATGFASLLAALLGALVWVGQRRVRH